MADSLNIPTQEAIAVRKGCLIAIGLVAPATVILLAYAVWTSREAVFDPEYVVALPRGSSPEEAERYLGVPLSRLSRIGDQYCVPTSRERHWHPTTVEVEERGVTLVFDDQGLLRGTGSYTTHAVDTSLMARLRRWTRQQW